MESSTAAPLYRRIYDDLEHKISTGVIRYREQLPPLPALCQIYGVSEAPVRRALEELERDKLVLRQRGRGKGTVAIKRLRPLTLRVLLMDEKLPTRPVPYQHEFIAVLDGIRAAAGEQGASVQLVSPSGYEHLAVPGGDTGYLIIGQGWGGYEQGARMAEQHDAPFVCINAPYAGLPGVRVDMAVGVFQAVNYLAQLGHKRIAYVGAWSGEWFAPRFEGYQRALSANGLPEDRSLVIRTSGADSEQDGNALDTLLTLPEPPTAVFTTSDYRALHLLARCRQRGIAVPRQLSLCGYDNISEVANIEPALTTVHHPCEEQGRQAVELMTEMLNGEPPANTDRVLDARLVVRASCAIPLR